MNLDWIYSRVNWCLGIATRPSYLNPLQCTIYIIRRLVCKVFIFGHINRVGMNGNARGPFFVHVSRNWRMGYSRMLDRLAEMLVLCQRVISILVTHSTWVWCLIRSSQPPWVSDYAGTQSTANFKGFFNENASTVDLHRRVSMARFWHKKKWPKIKQAAILSPHPSSLSLKHTRWHRFNKLRFKKTQCFVVLTFCCTIFFTHNYISIMKVICRVRKRKRRKKRKICWMHRICCFRMELYHRHSTQAVALISNQND